MKMKWNEMKELAVSNIIMEDIKEALNSGKRM